MADPEDKPLPLDSIQRFKELASRHDGMFKFPRRELPITAGDMYCPRCGDYRRMKIFPLFSVALEQQRDWSTKTFQQFEDYIPFLCSLKCVQCDACFTVVGYRGPSGDELVALPAEHGGRRTPNTPEGVAFYLDQAARAQSVGAHSAAIAMFRGALEQLLFEQGFVDGMLRRKLDDLEQQLAAGSGPRWISELEPELLKILKQLGDGSIHPNDGNITKQAAFDKELVVNVGTAFSLLLFNIYEAPIRKKVLMDSLRAKASIVKK